MADEHAANAAPNATTGSSQNSDATARRKLSPEELLARVQDQMEMRDIVNNLHREGERRKKVAQERIKSPRDYINEARDDAYAAEGDRIADSKQKKIDGINNAKIYSARRFQEEENLMSEETKKEVTIEKGDYNASDNQRKLLSKIYDRLHPYHKAHIDKHMLDTCARDEYKLSGKMVSQAIATSKSLGFLKYHMPQEEIAKLGVQEVNEQAKFYDGKATMNQLKALDKAGIEHKPDIAFDAAKELLNNRPATERQVQALSRFVENAESLTASEASAIFAKRQQDYQDELKQPVPESVRKIAIEHKFCKENQPYTNAEWKKDAMRTPITPGIKAQLNYYQIELKEGYDNLYGAHAAIASTIRRLDENKLAPVNDSQIDYLTKCGYIKEDSRYNDGSRPVIPGTYGQAQEAIWDAKYTTGLIGKADAKYLITHPDAPVPEKFLDAKKLRLDLSEAEKQAIRKETHEFVVKDKEERRMTAILQQDITPRDRTLVPDTARLVAYDHLDRDKGVIKDTAVKDMSKALLALNVNVTEGQLSRIPVLQDDKGNDIAPTKNQYLAHIITCVLPQGAANYKEFCSKTLKTVNQVDRGMQLAQKNKEKMAEISKEVQASKAKSQTKKNTADITG